MKMTNSYEINLRTKAWGLTIEGHTLILTAIHNRYNQFEYRDSLSIPHYDQLEEQELLDQIEDFLATHKVKRGDAFLGIPRSEVHTFVVEFPKEAEESLSDTIEYQIEGLYPGDVQEIDVFHQIIGRDDQLKVQVFCIPKTYIGMVFGLIRKWNLKLAGITINHLAIANGISRIYKTEFPKHQIAVVHIGDEAIELIGLRDGIISGVYSVQMGDAPTEEELSAAFGEGFSQIRIDPYEVDDFILSGFISEAMRLKLLSLGLEFKTLMDTKGNEIPPEGLLGVGLAQTALHERMPFKLNILPPKLQSRHHQLPVLLGIVAIILLAGWFVTGEVREYMDLKQELTRYESRNEKLREEVFELTKIRNRYEERQELVENYKKFIYGENLMLKVLSILTAELPDHSFLTSFAVRKGSSLTMQIETEDFFEVRSKLEKLPYFANVDTANAISQTRSGNKRKTNLKMDIVLEAFHE